MYRPSASDNGHETILLYLLQEYRHGNNVPQGMAEYELPYRFEPEIEEAAQAIDARVTTKEIAQRRDFRGVTTFTVDP